MENRSAAIRRVRISVMVALGILNVMGMVVPNSASADGKLRRVKKAVHRSPTKPKSNPKPDAKLPQREESHDSGRHDSSDRHEPDHHDSTDHQPSGTSRDHHSVRRDRQRQNEQRHSRSSFNHDRHGTRSSGIFLNLTTSSCVEPIFAPVVACPSDSYDPVLVQQPVPEQVAESVYRPVIVESIEPSPVPLSQDILLADAGLAYDWFDVETSKFWAVVGSDFDGITSGGLGMLLQSPGSIGLDSSVMTLRESDGAYRDHLWIGDVNLVYEILARGDIRGRVGLGVNWLSDSWGAEAGFNLTAGVDARLTDRLIFSAEGDVGNLGDADFFHGRINLARRLETCELMWGVDHFNFGGAEVNSVFTGIQFRF